MRKVLSCTQLVHDNEVQSNNKTEKHVYRDTGVVVITSNPGLRHCHKPGQIGVEQSPEPEACLRASVFPSLIRFMATSAVDTPSFVIPNSLESNDVQNSDSQKCPDFLVLFSVQ